MIVLRASRVVGLGHAEATQPAMAAPNPATLARVTIILVAS